MRRNDKYALMYLAALLPLSVVAVAWAVSGIPSERVDTVLIVFSSIFVLASSRLRVKLPKTDLHLSLADAIVLFSLVYFGGELAVILAAIAALATAIFADHEKPMSAVSWVINAGISVISIFVTAAAIMTTFGTPEETVASSGGIWFIVLIAMLAVLTFTINTLLTSAHLAIRGERHYWQAIKRHGADAALVYIGASIMAGLAVMALRETNIFLFSTVVGFFVILQIAFRRYKADYSESRELVARSEREKARLAEKHIAELKHYIGELEHSGQALRTSREKYRLVAHHDALTGLPNRNMFIETIDRMLETGRKSPKRPFALIYLDLHRFKMVNDSLGHAMGDELIARVADRLSELLEPGETIGRFNGDEFAILLPEVCETDDAEQFADRVAEALAQPFTLDRRQIFTGASMGIVIGNSDYSTAADLLRDADIAMYRAKERNRTYVVFEKKMHVQAISLLQLETDLRLAVDRDEFELLYQPIIALDTTEFCGVEALVRWRHPQFGLILPEQFIDVAEATGLIVPMTLQILETAFNQLNEWNRVEGGESLFVSVNLSGRHFTHPSVVEHISGILDKTQVNPANVKLEITETAVMDNAERAANVLAQIKALGVRLSIDDFGTGYSSLSYLQRFPIDALKIDRAFVRSMEDGRQNGEIVRAILALSNAMNLSVIAEGIESVHQLHQLRILDCKYGQGYLFSHPLPPDEITTLILNPNRWENLVAGPTFSIVPPVSDSSEARVH